MNLIVSVVVSIQSYGIIFKYNKNVDIFYSIGLILKPSLKYIGDLDKFTSVRIYASVNSLRAPEKCDDTNLNKTKFIKVIMCSVCERRWPVGFRNLFYARVARWSVAAKDAEAAARCWEIN